MTPREEALARFGYGPQWITSGVLDDAILHAQLADAELVSASPEHLRWAMWLHFANARAFDLHGAQLEAVLALDLAEARAPAPNLGHAIAYDVAKRASWRPQIERLCAHPVGASRPSFEAALLKSVLAIEETNQHIRERPRGWELRAASLEKRPTELLRSLGACSPLEAMFELSCAWRVPMASVGVAAEWVRGETDDATVDEALTVVRDTHADIWKLGLRIRDSVARDQIDEETARLARRRKMHTIIWLMVVCEIDLVVAKMTSLALEAMGSELLEHGTLSRVIDREIDREKRWKEAEKRSL